MGKSKGKATRTFTGTGRKTGEFTVETTLTDAEAIEVLRSRDNQFAQDCADHIELESMGLKARANLVAWGFRLCEQKDETVTISPKLLKLVRFRKPVSGEVNGEPFKLQLHGPGSKHAGQYMITDGEKWPGNRFYGRATAEGQWRVTADTPACVVERLKNF